MLQGFALRLRQNERSDEHPARGGHAVGFSMNFCPACLCFWNPLTGEKAYVVRPDERQDARDKTCHWCLVEEAKKKGQGTLL